MCKKQTMCNFSMKIWLSKIIISTSFHKSLLRVRTQDLWFTHLAEDHWTIMIWLVHSRSLDVMSYLNLGWRAVAIVPISMNSTHCMTMTWSRQHQHKDFKIDEYTWYITFLNMIFFLHLMLQRTDFVILAVTDDIHTS